MKTTVKCGLLSLPLNHDHFSPSKCTIKSKDSCFDELQKTQLFCLPKQEIHIWV